MKLRSSKSNVTNRSRLLALVGGAALVAMLVPSAFGADPVYATVTGHAEGSASNNNVSTWEDLTGTDCTKTADGAQLGDTYLLTSDYTLVIVKAGSESSAPGFVNTLFANASAGETVWADSNGDEVFTAADKGISHIIFCGPSEEESESPSESTPPSESTEPTDSAPPSESTEPTDSTPPSESTEPTESASPSESTEPSESASPSESTEPSESASPSESTPPSESTDPSPSGSVGTETDVPSSTPSDGGVEGETDTPTAPPTDAIGGSTSEPGGSLPLLLIVLGVIGLAAVVLTPARKRR